MVITQALLGMESTPFLKAFTVIIQFGAILSVICLYWRRFFYPETMRTHGYTWWQAIWRFYLRLIVGVLPAVVLGLAFNDYIEASLENVMLVAVMLIVGGVFMLFCDRIFNKGSEATCLTLKRAFFIGLIQCISMIPGVSRSMATIVGGMSQKLTRKAAAEFSFFLAVPTMAGATLLDLIEMFGQSNDWATSHNIAMLIVGCVVAFVVAMLAMKWFVGFITKYGFKAFGWYRIIVGGITLILLLTGHSLAMVD